MKFFGEPSYQDFSNTNLGFFFEQNSSVLLKIWWIWGHILPGSWITERFMNFWLFEFNFSFQSIAPDLKRACIIIKFIDWQRFYYFANFKFASLMMDWNFMVIIIIINASKIFVKGTTIIVKWEKVTLNVLLFKSPFFMAAYKHNRYHLISN